MSLRCLRKISCLCFFALLAGLGVAKADGNGGETLRIGIGKEIGSLDLALSLREETYPILDLAYETLVVCDRGEIHAADDCRPGIASSWGASEDGLVWTFEIAPGHVFDSGEEVTAHAVVFTFERLRSVARGPASAIDFIDRIEAIDEDMVQFRLRHPSTLLLTWLGSPLGYILNPRIKDHFDSDDHGSRWLGRRSAGSGPYYVAMYNHGGSVVLERNPHSRSAARFDRIIVEVVKDEAVRSLKLKEGELDIAFDFTPDLLRHLQAAEDLRVLSEPSLSITLLALNTESGPMSNVLVRRAVSHAIDYDAIVREIFQGHASTMSGPLPEGMFGYRPGSGPPAYDPAFAIGVLKEAGLPRDSVITLLYTGSTQRGEATAQVLQAMLGAIGLRVRLERLTLSALIDRAGRGDYDMALAGWRAEAADPALTINFWFDPDRAGPAGNLARYNNPQVGELLQRSARTLDPDRRQELLDAVLDHVREDVPYLYLSQDDVSVVSRCELQNYKLNPRAPFRIYVETLERRKRC